MKRVVMAAILFLIGAVVAVSASEESSVDKYIKDLKSKDPEIRANAAFELGCG
ncbi:MAG: hypothetical protein WCG29_10370 [Desulfomonile sp.]|jgi:HEAT repeat protein|nr:hypothetical protein [Deltaproteobacteria bacterium]